MARRHATSTAVALLSAVMSIMTTLTHTGPRLVKATTATHTVSSPCAQDCHIDYSTTLATLGTLPGGVTCICYPQLETSTGNLEINGDPTLEIALFPKLMSVTGCVNFTSNAALKTVNAGSLTTVGTYLTIVSNPLLETFDVSSLTTVGLYLLFTALPLLTSVGAPAFGNLVSCGGAIEIRNTTLPAVDLSKLAGALPGALQIDENTALVSVDARLLSSTTGYLRMKSNTLLQTVDLSSLTSCGTYFEFSGNPALQTLSAGSLTTVSTTLVVTSNPALVTLEICRLTSHGGMTLTGYGSPFSCMALHPGLHASCGPTGCPTPSATLSSPCAQDCHTDYSTTLATLGTLPGGVTCICYPELETFTGSIAVTANPTLQLALFPKLQTTSGGSFEFTSCPALVEVVAPSLETISAGNVDLHTNALLETCDLSSLTSVSGYINVGGSPLLHTLGLSSLTTVGSSMALASTALPTIALSSLTSVPSYLHVTGNPVLRILTAPVLSSVGTTFQITSNPQLETLTLCRLASHGGFTLTGYGSPFACGSQVLPSLHPSCGVAGGGCTATTTLTDSQSAFLEPMTTNTPSAVATKTVSLTTPLTPPTPPTTVTPSTLAPSALAPSTVVPSTVVPSTLAPSTLTPSPGATVIMAWSGDVAASGSTMSSGEVRTATLSVNITKGVTSGVGPATVNCSTSSTPDDIAILALVSAPSSLTSHVSTTFHLSPQAGTFPLGLEMLVVAQSTTLTCSATVVMKGGQTTWWSNLTLSADSTGCPSVWATTPTLDELPHLATTALIVNIEGQDLGRLPSRVLVGPYLVDTARNSDNVTGVATLPPAVTCAELLSATIPIVRSNSALSPASEAFLAYRVQQDPGLLPRMQALCDTKPPTFLLSANLFHWGDLSRCLVAPPSHALWAPLLQMEVTLRSSLTPTATNRRSASTATIEVEAGAPATSIRLRFTFVDPASGSVVPASEVGMSSVPHSTLASHQQDLSPALALFNDTAPSVDVGLSAPMDAQILVLYLNRTWGPRTFSTQVSFPVQRPTLAISTTQVERWVAVLAISNQESWGSARSVTLNVSTEAAIRFTMSSNNTDCQSNINDGTLQCSISQIPAGTTVDIPVNVSSRVRYNFNGAVVLRYSLGASNGKNSSMDGKLVLQPSFQNQDNSSTGSGRGNAVTSAPQGAAHSAKGVFGQGDGPLRCLDAFFFSTLISILLVLVVLLMARLCYNHKQKKEAGKEQEAVIPNTWQEIPLWRSLVIQHAYCVVPCHSQCHLNHTLPLVLHVFTLMMLCAAISSTFNSTGGDGTAVAITTTLALLLAAGLRPLVANVYYFTFSWARTEQGHVEGSFAGTSRKLPSNLGPKKAPNSMSAMSLSVTSLSARSNSKTAVMSVSMVALEKAQFDFADLDLDNMSHSSDADVIIVEDPTQSQANGGKTMQKLQDQEADTDNGREEKEEDEEEGYEDEDCNEDQSSRSQRTPRKQKQQEGDFPLGDYPLGDSPLGEGSNSMEERDDDDDDTDYSGVQWSVKTIVAPHRKKGHLLVLAVLSLMAIISLSLLTSSIQSAWQCSLFEASFGFAVLFDFVVVQPLVVVFTFFYRWLQQSNDEEHYWSELHPFDGAEREM